MEANKIHKTKGPFHSNVARKCKYNQCGTILDTTHIEPYQPFLSVLITNQTVSVAKEYHLKYQTGKTARLAQ